MVMEDKLFEKDEKNLWIEKGAEGLCASFQVPLKKNNSLQQVSEKQIYLCLMQFGGERDGQALNDMWRFHFATEFWEKLSFPTPTKPMPRAQTTAFILSQFKTRGAVHYLGLSEQNYCGSQPDPEKRTIITKDSPVKDNEALYEEIDDCKVNAAGEGSNTYTFHDPDNCLFEEEEEIEDKLTSKKNI
jgi:hypothetical protein